MTRANGYISRLVDPLIDDLLATFSAVMLVGPRATGKTTTARAHGSSLMRLDVRSGADAARADPDVALTTYIEPVVIDEWQLVPEILGAVKRSVDETPTPGRFILTGSSSADLTASGWPATGRVLRVPVWGFVQRELLGSHTTRPFISRLFNGDIGDIELPSTMPDLRDYVAMALRGGFPDVATTESARARRTWLASYIDQLVTHDLAAAGITRDPVRLRRYLRAVAANTAGIPEHKSIYDAAELNRVTGLAYDDVLQSLLVVEHIPAWASSRLGQMLRAPKRVLTDVSLVGPLLGLDDRSVLRSADLLGRVVDTFIIAQLRAELPLCDEQPTLFHLRQPNGRHEVDAVIEAADGRVIGIEAKADASPPASSARHLAWMRDKLGDSFAFGVVFHSGPRPFMIDERIAALPICAMWS